MTTLNDASNMPTTNARSMPLTLIVAATAKANGIGKNGQLPWPMLKKEMGYFKRVTSHTPPQPEGRPQWKNAVIMGKRTWESIPEKFRPLKGRINVVVSKMLAQRGIGQGVDTVKQGTSDGPLVVDNLDQAVSVLAEHMGASSDKNGADLRVHESYIIGGAMLYKAALSHPDVKRVLLTKIYTDYECDTWFPLDMDSSDASSRGWRRCSVQELEAAIGEDFGQGGEHARMEESNVEFEFSLYEKDASTG